MMKILSAVALAAALLSTPLLALDDTENLSAANVKLKKGKEEVMTGNSQDLGYSFKFKDNKDAKLHIWGLARMYFTPKSSSDKVTMPHFRFFIDGTKNAQWSFHARIDHGDHLGNTDYHKITEDRDPNSENTRYTPAPYFARAYMQYKAEDIKGLTIKMGRIYNQAHKFDVLYYSAWDRGATDGTYSSDTFGYTIPKYQVSDGAQVDYVNGGLELKGIVTYKSGGRDTEEFLYSGRAGYKHSLGFGKIEYGVAATTSSHNNAENQFVDIKPDFYLATKSGFWIFDQAMVREMVSAKPGVRTSDYELLYKNYFEVGQTVNLFGKDVDFDAYLSTTSYDEKSTSDVGVETFVKFREDFRGFIAFNYNDVFNEITTLDRPSNDLSRVGIKAFLSKYF